MLSAALEDFAGEAKDVGRYLQHLSTKLGGAVDAYVCASSGLMTDTDGNTVGSSILISVLSAYSLHPTSQAADTLEVLYDRSERVHVLSNVSVRGRQRGHRFS